MLVGINKNINENIKRAKKKLYDSTRYKDLPIISNSFIDFLSQSGERACSCTNGNPIVIFEEFADGSKIPKAVCSNCKNSFYKYDDYSFVMLMMGRKGGGKTTSVFSFADKIHEFDGHRKIKLWQCPKNLISVLHNLKLCKYYKTLCDRAIGKIKWSSVSPIFVNPDEEKPKELIMPLFQKNEEEHCVCKFEIECEKCKHYQLGKKYFDRLERLDQVEYNDILIIDEGIISVNAKEALSKKMRDFDKFMAVVRHNRIVLFCLFQRFEIIKAMKEMSDMILYKSLPQKLIENEKYDKFLINHGDRIRKLKKSEGILLSDHQNFDNMGIINNGVPEWYTKEVSMSYMSSYEFLDHSLEEQADMERAEMLANHLIDIGIPPLNKPNEIKGAKYILRKDYADLKPPLNSKQLNMAIEAYYKLTLFDIQSSQSDEFVKEMEKQGEDVSMLQNLESAGISTKDLKIFEEICNGKAVTKFNEPPYNLPKQRISEIFRKVGLYALQILKQGGIREKGDSRDGVESERRVVKEAWINDGYAIRSVGSGGIRGGIPNPDCLEVTNDGKIRAVQVKERETLKNPTFSPLTFNTEFQVINQLRTIAQNSSIKCPHCLENVKGVLIPESAYLYVMSKDPSEPIIKEKLTYDDNKKTLKVDFTNYKIIRQDPDMNKVKTPKLKEFLESKNKIYWGEEEIDSNNENSDEDPKEKEELNKELDEMVNFDKLLKEVGVKT